MGMLFRISSEHFELLAILPLNASIGVIEVLANLLKKSLLIPHGQPFASFATKKLVVIALFQNSLCQSIREH